MAVLWQTAANETEKRVAYSGGLVLSVSDDPFVRL